MRIADLSESNVDPLARAVRHRLSRQLGIREGIPVLLSTEKPRCRLVPIEEVGENPLDYQVCGLALVAGSSQQRDALQSPCSTADSEATLLPVPMENPLAIRWAESFL